MRERAVARFDALLAACQRRPWRASLVMAVVGGGVVWASARTLAFRVELSLSACAAGALVIALGTHLVRHARVWMDRTAPVVVLGLVLAAHAAFASPTNLRYVQAGGNVTLTQNEGVTILRGGDVYITSAPDPVEQRLARTGAATILALLVAGFLPVRRRPFSRAREVAMGTLVAAALLCPFPEWVPPEVVVALRVLVPLEAVARSEMHGRTLVALGALAGAAAWAGVIARSGSRVFLDLSHQPLYVVTLGSWSPWLTYTVLGAAVAAAGILARRARSMTAVPLDHTILADFGKTVPGTVRVITPSRPGS